MAELCSFCWKSIFSKASCGSQHSKNGIWIIHGNISIIQGGNRKITVCSSTLFGVNSTFCCHTVKCTGTHRNFSSATMNYQNAVFCVRILSQTSFLNQNNRLIIVLEESKQRAWRRFFFQGKCQVFKIFLKILTLFFISFF